MQNARARSVLTLSAALLIIGAVAAVYGLTSGHAQPPSASGGCERSAGWHRVAGEPVFVPRDVPAKPVLVIAFHGAGSNGAELAADDDLDSVAAREHLVLAYPNAAHNGVWQLNRADGGDDIAMTKRLIQEAVTQLCVDPSRVYATGLSNGAGFAARVGCDLQPLVAAIAPVAGSYSSHDTCPASRGPMPTLEQHGQDPWTNTVPRLIRMTAARNRCTKGQRKTYLASGAVRTTWIGCDLERVFFADLGHVWPPDAGERLWRFVRQYRR
jgi:polyhydroxybutyrate depolymerase